MTGWPSGARDARSRAASVMFGPSLMFG